MYMYKDNNSCQEAEKMKIQSTLRPANDVTEWSTQEAPWHSSPAQYWGGGTKVPNVILTSFLG